MSDKEDSDDSKDKNEHDNKSNSKPTRREKKLMVLSNFLTKQESRNTVKKISHILNKAEKDRTTEENACLGINSVVVKRLLKSRGRKKLTKEREQETEDPVVELQQKCEYLAEAIQQSKSVTIYTGAGISTAASIPDYRGPQGIWTLLQRGETLEPQDLSDAEPTITHMIIAQLQKEGHVRHVVSQNCDGLHLRSGMPRRALSEVHGNMYIEICYNCKPHREYIRLFDVTERTGLRKHFTERLCKKCGGKLRDTIVHFGEKGGQKSPYRWKEASKSANNSDLILCLGTSLKILKAYPCLWCMDRTRNKRPKLIIVNLQWTPKDDSAALKINGKCDDVLQRVMMILGYTIPSYSRESDPIFRLSTPLSADESETTSKKILEAPATLCKSRSRSASICSTGTENSSTSTESSASGSQKNFPVLDTVVETREAKCAELSLNVQENVSYFTANNRDISIPDRYSAVNIGPRNGASEQNLASPATVSCLISPSTLPVEVGGEPSLMNDTVKLSDMPLLAQAQFLQLQMQMHFHQQPDQSIPIDLSNSGNSVKDSQGDLTSPSASLSFAELVERLTTCPSCTFLKEYGVKKQRCTICDRLKLAHTAFHNEYISSIDTQGSSSTKAKKVRQEQTRTSASTSKQCKIETNQTLTDTDKPHSMASNSTVDSVIEDHFYLKPEEMQRLSPRSQWRKSSLDDRVALQENSGIKNELLDFTRNTTNTSTILNEHLQSSTSAETTFKICDEIQTAPGLEAIPLAGHGSILSLPHPPMYVRSLSDNIDPSLHDTDDKNTTEGGEKRKLTRCLSVPGWFGKGLNPKKRRKF